MQADETFRTSPWAMLALPVILLAAGIALGWALLSGHLPGIFWVGFVILALLVPFALQVNALPAFRSSNWVLKIRGDRLYLMLRNYRSTHLPEDAPVVVSFDASEIASVGQQMRQFAVPSGSGRTRHWKERRLEIRLRDPVPPEFITALQTQPEWSETWYGRRRNDASPVSCDERTIRILWSGPHDLIVPRINRALAILGRIVPVHDTSVVDRRQPMHLTDSQFDDHVLELCQAGNRIDAIRLLRERRNYSLSEAKRWVDEITE